MALATPALAQDDDPKVLFAAGRYAAAAEIFEHRWESRRDAVDGVNAVVSWRTAGRYARAAALLARVRASDPPPAGEAAQTASALEERLATLTATATITGPLARDAVIRVDNDPAERLGADLILDVGEHDIVIEQESCKPFAWHGAVFPGQHLEIPFAPTCDRAGTLYVYLAGDPGTPFEVDRKPYRTTGHEARIELAPGTHALRVTSRGRPILDEPVTIREHETTALRVRYPWRARSVGWIFAVTGTMRAGGVQNGLGLALTTGFAGSRFRVSAEVGSVISDVGRLVPGPTGPGRPWAGLSGVWHVTHRPLWHGRIGSLDFDPVALRYDEVREASFLGIRADEREAMARAWSFLPLTLTHDARYVHLEITLWPVSIVHYRAGQDTAAGRVFETELGVGSFVTIVGGWRLL
jgi:hypothetical protein